MDIMTLAAKINLDSSGFESGLKASESKLKGYGDKISAWAVAKGKVVGGLIEKAGQSTIGFVKGAVDERMEFDKAMAQVAATLGKTTDEVQELSNFARQMGAETAFSANEAAQALNYMALAGYDSTTSMKMLPTVLNLAAAGNFDLARASDMVTDAQSALGLSVEETETMVDQMAKTASKTNTSVEQLGDAFLTVGGTAKNLKGSTKELSALLGVLADNGIKGSEGGTALRNVMLSLTAPTDKAAKTLKKFNIDAFDSSGNMKDFPTILEEINKATSEMSEAERTDFLSTVFNKRDLKSIEALLGTSKDRWAELYDAIGNSGGAASQMASTQLDNLKGDLTIFKSALSETRLSIVEKLTPALRKLTQFGTKSIQQLTKAFNSGTGLNGVLTVAGNMFNLFVSRLKDSGNPALKKTGEIIDYIRDGFKVLKLSFTDFPSALKKGKELFSKIFNDIKGAAKKARIKVADILHIEDAENATWGDIGRKIIDNIKLKLEADKIKLAEYFNVEDAENATWGSIAGAAFEKIKEAFKTKATEAQIKLANWLGLTDSGGNPVDSADDTSWRAIGEALIGKIKDGFTNVRIKIAELLNIDDPQESTWADIGKEIKERLKTGIKKTQVKLAELLDIDDPEEASWADIGRKIKERLTTGVGKAKVKLAELLGLSAESVEGEDGWEAIGRAVVNKLTEHLSHKGDFLKKLILGDEFDPEKSTWLDVGTKIAGWIEESFGEGGFLNTLLTSGLDKLTGLAPLIGQIMTGFANWVKSNSGQIVGIITSIANAIAEAAGPIVEALAKILTDEDLWTGLGHALEAAVLAILEALGLYHPTTVQTEPTKPKEEKGKRQLHGEGLSPKQLDSIIQAWDLWKNQPNASFILDGKRQTAEEMYENVFRTILGANNFRPEDIDRLWGEVQTEDGIEFDKTLTDLTNASQDYGIILDDLGNSSSATTENIDALGASAAGARDELNSIHAPSWAGGEDNSSADGLWNVPYDDYISKLHRGEMVLTASQARKYREGDGNVNFSNLEDRIVSAIRAGMAGANVNAYVNGQSMTDVVNTRTSNELKGRRFAP